MFWSKMKKKKCIFRVFKERLCSMAPPSKSKLNPTRKSKRNVKKGDRVTRTLKWTG